MRLRRSFLLPLLPSLVVGTLLPGCQRAETVVIVTSPGTDGVEVPIAGKAFVVLPYDRDSITQVLTAAATPRPDTLELGRLLDSLRGAYRRYLAAPAAERPAAKTALDRLTERSAPRLVALRLAQTAWRDSAYRSYDSLTYALFRHLARDPFADTTDVRGMALVAPSRAGPWWVTFQTWDARDPYTEWYWNVPLVGDTLRLTAANAQRRSRF